MILDHKGSVVSDQKNGLSQIPVSIWVCDPQIYSHGNVFCLWKIGRVLWVSVKSEYLDSMVVKLKNVSPALAVSLVAEQTIVGVYGSQSGFCQPHPDTHFVALIVVAQHVLLLSDRKCRCNGFASAKRIDDQYLQAIGDITCF